MVRLKKGKIRICVCRCNISKWISFVNSANENTCRHTPNKIFKRTIALPLKPVFAKFVHSFSIFLNHFFLLSGFQIRTCLASIQYTFCQHSVSPASCQFSAICYLEFEQLLQLFLLFSQSIGPDLFLVLARIFGPQFLVSLPS